MNVTDAAALARFRRLVIATLAATLVLMLIGGAVRVSDSGLGCGPAGSGLHGWPLCEGGLLPEASASSIVEFSHRLSAAVVGLMVLGLALLARRRLSARRDLVRGSLAALVLVVVQAVLGGITVEYDLHEYAVAAHLGLAMLLVGLLLFLHHRARPGLAALDASRALRLLSTAGVVLVFLTIVAGGLVAGTEGHGRSEQPELGAHMACGTQFPGCLNRFMPFGVDRLVDIHLTHRLFMYLTALAILAAALVAARQRIGTRLFTIAALVTAAQILLGAINVWSGKHPGLILAHLALGTALWMVVVLARLRLTPGAQPVEGGSRTADETAEAKA